jgi:hypothetical protein
MFGFPAPIPSSPFDSNLLTLLGNGKNLGCAPMMAKERPGRDSNPQSLPISVTGKQRLAIRPPGRVYDGLNGVLKPNGKASSRFLASTKDGRRASCHLVRLPMMVHRLSSVCSSSSSCWCSTVPKRSKSRVAVSFCIRVCRSKDDLKSTCSFCAKVQSLGALEFDGLRREIGQGLKTSAFAILSFEDAAS